ncbi:MAG: GNAT family N-acetyltransferase [Chloroflexi bacterium]|nr:GNAT family N-acetyltransferase [Chloroflexota bacterium]
MGADQHVTLRRATSADVDAILDLLTEYDLPRRHFEPLYLSDPGYRPSDSWLVEEDGQLAAHLRVFERTILIDGVGMRVAGIGNVITGRAYRGRGHASRLLHWVLGTLRDEGYAYSLLGTDIPSLYARVGFVSITQSAVRATLGPVDLRWDGEITRFEMGDLPEVADLYIADNAHRTGPTVRNGDYWRRQLTWQAGDAEAFLVARTGSGKLAGYIRVDHGVAPTRVLELILGEHLEAGRALLSHVAGRYGREFQAHLPPSRIKLFDPDERTIDTESGLMGRVVSLETFVDTVRPLWEHRLFEAGVPGVLLRLDTSCGACEVQLGDGSLVLGPLSEEHLADLLFHGCDHTAENILFPPQDFVLWSADDF